MTSFIVHITKKAKIFKLNVKNVELSNILTSNSIGR